MKYVYKVSDVEAVYSSKKKAIDSVKHLIESHKGYTTEIDEGKYEINYCFKDGLGRQRYINIQKLSVL